MWEEACGREEEFRPLSLLVGPVLFTRACESLFTGTVCHRPYSLQFDQHEKRPTEYQFHSQRVPSPILFSLVSSVVPTRSDRGHTARCDCEWICGALLRSLPAGVALSVCVTNTNAPRSIYERITLLLFRASCGCTWDIHSARDQIISADRQESSKEVHLRKFTVSSSRKEDQSGHEYFSYRKIVILVNI